MKREPGGCAIPGALVLLILAVGGLGGGGIGAGIIFLLCAIGLGIYAVNAISGSKEEHKAALIEWEAKTERLKKGWLCHRCGNSWVPE
jgi:hypothetical protein